MMNSCQCQGIEEVFSQPYTSKELSQYRKKGAIKTTRLLIEALKSEGVQGLTLLDVGGGLGAIQHELLGAGAEHAIHVDASNAYIAASQEEAQRRGHSQRVSFHHGDFVDLAAGIPPADIVTLDRVICCYPDMEQLVGLSAARARKLYGLVYPRDTWWMKVGVAVMNLIYRLRRNPYRGFVHSSKAVEAVVSGSGLRRHSYRRTLFWQVVVYAH